MAKVRHSDKPERRRPSYERLAVLALLALGSNLGCGRELLRVPAVSKTPPPIPADIPAAVAATNRSKGMKPVAIRAVADYGSSLDELFPATYRNPMAYGPHLAGTTIPRPEDPARPGPRGLIAALETGKIPPPKPFRPEPVGGQPATRKDRDPLLAACEDSRIPPPAVTPLSSLAQAPAPTPDSPQPPPTVAAASESTTIAPQKPVEVGNQSKLPVLEQASNDTGIALPVAPTIGHGEPAGEVKVAERPPVAEIAPPLEPTNPVEPDTALAETKMAPPVPAAAPVEAGNAFEETRIAPPIPAAEARGPAPADAFEETRIAPPIPAAEARGPAPANVPADAFGETRIAPPVPASERRSQPGGTVPEVDLPPPLQLDPSLFQTTVPGSQPGLPPPSAPAVEPPAPATPPTDQAGLAAACQATRIALPTPPGSAMSKGRGSRP